MKKTKTEMRREQLKKKVIHVSAINFLKYGYTRTTIKDITTQAGISTGSFNNLYQTKEDVLCELVGFVLAQQFAVTQKLLEGKSDNKLHFYAVETTLQLSLVERNENLRDLYLNAYSLPKPSALIQKSITGKWEKLFKEYLPDYKTKDFYKLEIATGGIMRGFMTVPCDMWFTMDQKIEAFLECTFKMYNVPGEQIQEAICFVKQFDFDTIAEDTLNGIFNLLESPAE